MVELIQISVISFLELSLVSLFFQALSMTFFLEKIKLGKYKNKVQCVFGTHYNFEVVLNRMIYYSGLN